jgi:hypothetical protein
VHASKLGRLLERDTELQPLVAKARSLGALSKQCVDFLPAELARQIQACNLKDDRLVILAATPAAAAKLKLWSESLCKFLLLQGSKVKTVSVRVQPNVSPSRHAPSYKKATLSSGGVAALRELHDKLPPSPAREALKTLLDHHLEAGKKNR